MGFYRDDFYDECKSYVRAIEMLEFIEDYWKYDLSAYIIETIKAECYQTIEFYEKKYHNKVLRE